MKINLLNRYKICSSNYCPFNGDPQPLENFSKDTKGKNGLFAKCKTCNKIYREKNQDQIILYLKNYYQQNKEQFKINSKLYRETHKEEIKQYLQDHKEEINIVENIYRNKRRQEDINFRLAENLRTRIGEAIKNGQKTGSAIADLCCSISDFKVWIEEQFYCNPKTGEIMSWDNYGKLWHIDHIIPLSAVDLTDRKQLKKVCHWFNLRPRWAYQNIGESDRGMSINK